MLGSVAIALFLRVMGTALWLLFTVVVARGLTVEDFGFVFFVINVIMTGGAMVVLGYDVTMMRFGARFWRDGEKQAFRNILAEARGGVSVSGLIAVVLLVIAALFGLDTPVTGDVSVALLTGVSIVAVGFMSVERDALRAGDKLQEALFAFSVIRALVPMVLTLGAWGLGLLSGSVVLLFYFVALVCALLWDRWQLGKLDLPVRVKLGFPHFRIAIETWPGNASLIIFQRVPTIVVGLIGGLEAAALYIAAERVSQLSNFLTDAVRTAVGPSLAKADIPEEQQKALSYASLLMALSGTVGALLTLLLGGGILWGLGPDYKGAFPALLILMFGQLSWGVFGPTALVLNMMGHNKMRSLIGMVAAISLIITLPAAETAVTTAWVVAVISWAMNLALWLVIRFRLELKSGLFGISRITVCSALSQDWRIVRRKLSKLWGKRQ